MKGFASMLSRAVWSVSLLGAVLVLGGCDEQGNVTERALPGPGGESTISDRSISGIAGPPDASQTRPVERVDRALFATSNTVNALIYPSATAEERAVFQRALNFFITDRTPANGLGPLFNQRICLGCHRSSDDVASLTSAQRSGNDAVLTNVSTPASRASRQGPTDHERLNSEIIAAIGAGRLIGTDETVGKPPTAAFTLFGDFFPAAGAFNPLTDFGGPIQHIRATGACYPDFLPPESIDPFLQGGIDPATGLSVLGGRRAIGERGAPPYIGRGLMEAIFADDLVASEDPEDRQGHASSLLAPSLTNSGCRTDCISGKHNENAPGFAFPVLDPVVRVARFGLRGFGPSLIQFMLGGTSQEIGVTSPLGPVENNNNQNVGRECDIAPDPELTTDDILDLRLLLRMISLPDLDPCLLGTSDTCLTTGNTGSQATMRASMENGARLFGIDLDAFRSRLIAGRTPVGDAQGINQTDRQLNCVGCHTPIARSGQSPSELGAQHLSNRWFPLFSDLLLHDMGSLPQGTSNPVPPNPPRDLLRADGTFEMSRNLADFALPGQGFAFGSEWRTPPLMGLGKVGPPFMHDLRVYLSNRSHPNGDPQRRTSTTRSNATISNERFTVDSLDAALGAAIELHDLPDPEGAALPGGRPQATANSCPVTTGGSASVICPPLTSGSRSEARNVMQRWRILTPQQQLDVINFLKAL